MKNLQTNSNKDLNKDHRKRMRQRYVVSEFSGMHDYQILEFMLFYAIPRIDTKRIARNLLDEFGSLENVFSADVLRLQMIDGIGESTAIYLNALGKLMAEIKQRKLSKNKRLTKSNFKEYLIANLMNEKTEKLYAIFFNKGNTIINYKLLCEGGIDSLQFDISNILREAVLHKASGVILAHNHPGGHREPSDSDIAVTMNIARALNGIGITLKDHVIIAGGDCYSMAEKNKIF